MNVLAFDDIYLSYFYAVDFGNFMFFLFCVPLYLKNTYAIEGASPNFSISKVLRDVGIPNIIVIAVIILLFFDFGKAMAEPVKTFIEPTQEARKFLLLYLSFCLVFLKMDTNMPHFNLIINILFIFTCRFIALGVLAFLLLMVAGEITLMKYITNEYLLALTVLALCPPSSLVGGQIEIHTENDDLVAFANTINIYMVMIYFAAIGIILLLSFFANSS
jgi:hypothetical protein